MKIDEIDKKNDESDTRQAFDMKIFNANVLRPKNSIHPILNYPLPKSYKLKYILGPLYKHDDHIVDCFCFMSIE